MAATGTALISQNFGSSVLTAWPQPTGAGVGSPNQDLIHIADQGNQKLVVVQYNGTVLSGAQNGLVLTSVAVSSFTATSVAASTGVNTYTGTFTGGNSNAFVGKSVVVLGFANSANNGTFVITGSGPTTFTAAVVSGVTETGPVAGTASVYGVSATTYNGTITNTVSANTQLTVTGFTNAINNVTNANVTSSTGSTIVTPYSGQIAETKSALASIGIPLALGGPRIGKYYTRLTVGATLAAIFADAFTNPSNLDIIQIFNEGGNISYYLSYQGIATGS